MAEKHQINPKITQAVYVQLAAYCKDHSANQGDVVDAALQSFFTPGTGGDSTQLIMDKLRENDVVMGKVLKFLQTITTHIEAAAAPPPPMAAYWGGLYNGKLEPPVVEEPVVEERSHVMQQGPSRLARTFSAVWRRR